MASLKEVKDRISSVNSTRKITSAMKMIASAKLHKAQAAITHFLPYSDSLNSMLVSLLASDANYDSPFAQKREVKKVAIVTFSSNSSLCGGFNANVIKEFNTTFHKYQHLGKENILIYPVGKKIASAIIKQNMDVQGDYQEMADKPAYKDVKSLAQSLIEKYLSKELDQIVLIYHHFKSTGSQVLKNEIFLPFNLDNVAIEAQDNRNNNFQLDYILEPSHDAILSALIPKVLVSQMFAALLDSNASEHAARTVAMQIATDNADDLIQDLTIQYNKTRQQSITNELLDIIGGASALE